MAEGKSFMCGVCEGFYGKPWSSEQRGDLYRKMEKMQLNTYLYAPKDDYKHRLCWRDLYTEEEAEELQSIIHMATERGVTFVYAISPGLDIGYSDKQDINALINKLDQVVSLGCQSFALLFDDIETDLSRADLEMYGSLAAAQSSLTNTIHQHLKNPKVFLFCPTEYCSSRAVPDLTSSKYLQTIGKQLDSGVDILWTGPKVVSRRLSLTEMEEVKSVLQRPPVIWDNLHANDYDQTRLYIGPYEGRPPELSSFLRGVLTNPNTEYEMNFIAFHTLAQWAKGTTQRFFTDQDDKSGLDCDVDMEEDEESGYLPRKALLKAICDWIPHFYEPRGSKPKLPVIICKKVPKLDNIQTGPPDAKVAKNKDKAETMTRKENKEDKEEDMDIDNIKESKKKRKIDEMERLTVNDLTILCDLFYTPFEHGACAVQVLRLGHWLISNTDYIKGTHNLPHSEQTPQSREWYANAMKFHDFNKDVGILLDKVVNIPNRILLYQLYNYIIDMRSVVSMLNSYIKWYGLGKPEKEPFRTGEQEPWVYRGGLYAELRRLLPIEGQNDMFPPPNREPPATKVYTVRPYFCEDKADVYAVCRKMCDDIFDGSYIFPDYPDLIGDESIGGILSLYPEFCYVVEDDVGVCGYAVAAPNIQEYEKKAEESWLPKMRKKYPQTRLTRNSKIAPSKVLTESFHSETRQTPDSLCDKFPAIFYMAVIPSRIHDRLAPRQLLNCVVRMLSASGAKGLHTRINRAHTNTLALHVHLGLEALPTDSTDDEAEEDSDEEEQDIKILVKSI